MASINVTVSPSYVSSQGDSWQSYDSGWIGNNWSTMEITSATYNTDTSVLTLNYALKINRSSYGSSCPGWNVAAIAGWINGTQVKFLHNSSGFIDSSWYDQDGGTRLTQTLGTGTYTIENWTPGTSITMRVRSLQDWGYTSARWDNNNYTSDSGSDPVTPTPDIYAPTLSAVTISNITRTSAQASFTITDNGGASIVDNTRKIKLSTSNSDFSNPIATISGLSGTFSGLSNYTTYYARAEASNGTATGYSAVQSFTTLGRAPTITNVTATPALNSCSIAVTATYYDSASFASMEISYGKSTSYSSTISENTTTYSLSPLDSKTTYYYKIVIVDNYGKRSSPYTGSFTTTSTAPTNVSMVATNIGSSSADVFFNFSIGIPDYPTSGTITVTGTGYSQTKNLTWTLPGDGTPPAYQPATFTGLSPDTTYTMSGSLTNSTGTGNATSSTFTTAAANPPSISAVSITSSGTTGISVSITASSGAGNTLQYRFSKDGGTNWSNYQNGSTYSYTGLTAGSTYNVCFEIRDGNRFTYEYYTITLPTSSGTTTKGNIQYRQDGWWGNTKKIYIAKYSKWLTNPSF